MRLLLLCVGVLALIAAAHAVDKVGMMRSRHRLGSKALPATSCKSGDDLYKAVCADKAILAAATRFKDAKTSPGKYPLSGATAAFAKARTLLDEGKKLLVAYMSSLSPEDGKKIAEDVARRDFDTDPASATYDPQIFDSWNAPSMQSSHDNAATTISFSRVDLTLLNGLDDAAMQFTEVHEIGHRYDVEYAEGLDSKDKTPANLGIGAIMKKAFGGMYAKMKAANTAHHGNWKTEYFCDYVALSAMSGKGPLTTDQAVQIAGMFCDNVVLEGGDHPTNKDRVLTILRHPQVYPQVCDTENGARGTKDTDWFEIPSPPAQKFQSELKALGADPLKKLKPIRPNTCAELAKTDCAKCTGSRATEDGACVWVDEDDNHCISRKLAQELKLPGRLVVAHPTACKK